MADFKRALPIAVEYKPTVYKNSTRASRLLTWWNCDNVRFVDGRPRKILGWTKAFTDQVTGTPRSMFSWTDLSGRLHMGIGTHLKYYVERGGAVADVTPIRQTTSPLANNPITTGTIGTGVITVTDTGHGAGIGDYVTLSGATATDGLTTGDLNKEHVILSVPTGDTWTADTGGVATAGATAGGGAAVDAAYQITVGQNSVVPGTGWGAGAWGRSTWGSSSSVTVPGAQIRLWSQDNWGEDLAFSPRGGAIYYYDSSSATRGVNISALGGANETPVIADQILAAGDARIMLAFGTNPLGTSTADPMHYRWCDLENLPEWEPTTTNSAGGNNLPIGSLFMQAVRMRQEIVAFTDKAMYSIQFTGDGDSVFAQKQIATGTTIVGPKAAAFVDDKLYWMSRRGFAVYGGRVDKLDCTVLDYVFNDFNIDQAWKTHCAINSLFSEVTWHYCSADSTEIDRRVTYNYSDGSWTIGGSAMARTAWIDNAGSLSLPRGASSDGYIYDHESGLDDGSTMPVTAITAFIEGSAVELGDGDRQGFLRTIWPDLTFDGSTAAMPSVNLIVKLSDKSVEAIHTTTTSEVVRSTTTPIETMTEKCDIGVRGRFAAFRIESDDVGVMWGLGLPRILTTGDGRR